MYERIIAFGISVNLVARRRYYELHALKKLIEAHPPLVSPPSFSLACLLMNNLIFVI